MRSKYHRKIYRVVYGGEYRGTYGVYMKHWFEESRIQYNPLKTFWEEQREERFCYA